MSSWRSSRYPDRGSRARFGDYMRLKGIFPMNGDDDDDDDDDNMDEADEEHHHHHHGSPPPHYLAPTVDRGMYTICANHSAGQGLHGGPSPHALDAVLEITKQVG